MNDELISMMRQLIRHVAHALKKYFEAHLSHKVDEIKRSHTHSDDDGSPVHETPAYKVGFHSYRYWAFWKSDYSVKIPWNVKKLTDTL